MVGGVLLQDLLERHLAVQLGIHGHEHLAQPAAPERGDDLLGLDEALEKLAATDPVKVQLVRLLVFAGLTLAEAAEILGLSTATADRYWAHAQVWLRVEIAGDSPSGPGPDS
jgi:DNA-directed RNA polymerase specialized sigma24 family protein